MERTMTKITYMIHDHTAKDNHRFVSLQGKPAETIIRKIKRTVRVPLCNGLLIRDLLLWIDEIEE